MVIPSGALKYAELPVPSCDPAVPPTKDVTVPVAISIFSIEFTDLAAMYNDVPSVVKYPPEEAVYVVRVPPVKEILLITVLFVLET